MFRKYSSLLVILIITGLVGGCAAPIRVMSEQKLIDNLPVYSETYEQDLIRISEKGGNRVRSEYLNSETQSYDILVLSGGGEYGAFGAGFLQAWGEVEEGLLTRPEFDSVSGISTGALIAPFAFVGTDEAYAEIVNLYENPNDNLIVPKTIFTFLLGQGAYYDATVLHERIRKSITKTLVEQMAIGDSENRNLLVGATNLDYGSMRVWDLSHIAATKPVDEAIDMISKRLIASSAIPSAFPPIMIDDYLYVDGGASLQVVSGIDDRQWLYTDEQQTGVELIDEQPIKLRIWIIVNNKLSMDPSVTRKSWENIAVRSLETLMNASTLQTIQDVETFANLINKRSEFDVEMRYVAIPNDYEILQTEKLFDMQKMRDLVKLGRKMGSDPSSWKQRAIRPGAAVIDRQKE